MTLQDYLKLKNGSDVRGVALDGVENEPITLTTEAAKNIAKAFCVWLISRTGKTKVKIAVGYDSRLSAQKLCRAVVKGITSTGHDAVVTGLSTTPSMFALLQDDTWEEEPCHGSIVITASHLPFNRNGLKFFFKEGGVESEDITEILTLAADFRFAEVQTKGKVIEKSYMNEYALSLVEKVRKDTADEFPLAGKHIIVDAGNGTGGFFAEKVLKPLGANTKGSQFLEPDGRFLGHIPNPENEAAMKSICDAVKDTGAELGVIFDTDADRAAIVDQNGNAINRNALIALISAVLLEEKQGGMIVTDSVTSEGLTKFIEQKGGIHRRYKRGYKNVINEAKEMSRKGHYVPLAIETSGHAALKENYYLDDGAYLVVKLLIALSNASKRGKSLQDYIADLEVPAEEAEIRLSFHADCDFKGEGAAILKDFETYLSSYEYANATEDNYEGVRAEYDDAHGAGLALLRMSLHDPILPINVESRKAGGTLKILKNLYRFLEKYPCLDLKPLKKAIEKARKVLLCNLKTASKENKLDFLTQFDGFYV